MLKIIPRIFLISSKVTFFQEFHVHLWCSGRLSLITLPAFTKTSNKYPVSINSKKNMGRAFCRTSTLMAGLSLNWNVLILGTSFFHSLSVLTFTSFSEPELWTTDDWSSSISTEASLFRGGAIYLLSLVLTLLILPLFVRTLPLNCEFKTLERGFPFI